MQYQINNTKEGYIVKVYIRKDLNNLWGNWYPLRNFGERQGDAIRFRDIDCPKLTEGDIKTLIKTYNHRTKYIRINSERFIKQYE